MNTYHIILNNHSELLSGQLYRNVSYWIENGIITDIALADDEWLQYPNKGILVKNLSINEIDICALILKGELFNVPARCVNVFWPFRWELHD